VDVFSCRQCTAEAEPIPDSNLAVVRHAFDCETLQAQVRARWPLTPATLPDVPGQIPFQHLAAFGRWHKTVRVREERRLVMRP
jgi:hypothetical protein